MKFVKLAADSQAIFIKKIRLSRKSFCVKYCGKLIYFLMSHFHPSLIFAGKARKEYLSDKHTRLLHYTINYDSKSYIVQALPAIAKNFVVFFITDNMKK